jgi:hypothetical protein
MRAQVVKRWFHEQPPLSLTKRWFPWQLSTAAKLEFSCTMNKIVQLIHKDRRLKQAVIDACEKDGEPITPQGLGQWRKLRNGVPASRARTVARVTGLTLHVIRPDIFPRGS